MSRPSDDELLAWYEAGLTHGIELGRRQLIDEWRGTMAVSAAIARMIAGGEPYADLADRRGEDDRAAAQRQLLRDRGVSL